MSELKPGDRVKIVALGEEKSRAPLNFSRYIGTTANIYSMDCDGRLYFRTAGIEGTELVPTFNMFSWLPCEVERVPATD